MTIRLESPVRSRLIEQVSGGVPFSNRNETFKAGVAHKLFRQLVYSRCKKLTGGELTLRDSIGSLRVGEKDADLRAHIEVRRAQFYRRVLFQGGLGLAGSYIDGDWETSDLTSLIRILIRSLDVSERVNRGWHWLTHLPARVAHAQNKNTKSGSKKNIVAHYDLGNDFYRLWLDPTMNYSSGVFASSTDSMETASIRKMDLACRKLALSPKDHLLEIGSGWGAMAIHAAKNFGCRVTTTTISEQQHAYVSNRIKQEGLESQITVLKSDYRDLNGQYDKLISIEMIEAVGPQFYDTYFEKLNSLLKPEGIALLQAIVIAEHRFERHIKEVDFIKRFVFPGGSLPSVSALLESASKVAKFRPLHMEDYAAHYAETLRRWRHSFFEQENEVRKLGLGDPFIRLWNYYLCYCEAAFDECQVNLVQLVFGKHQSRFDVFEKYTNQGVTSSHDNNHAIVRSGKVNWEREQQAYAVK